MDMGAVTEDVHWVSGYESHSLRRMIRASGTNGILDNGKHFRLSIMLGIMI